MPDEPNLSGGNQDADNQGGGGEDGKGGEDDKWYDKISADDVITTSKLQSIIKASDAKTSKDIESAIAKATSGIPESVKDIVLKALKEAPPTKVDGKGKDNQKSDETALELAALQRQLQESTDQITKLQDNLSGEQTKAQAMKKKGLIMAALQEHKCARPEVAYKFIVDDVKYDAEKDECYVEQDNSFGATEHRPLSEYVSKEVRIDQLPELFTGANRSGSPATGSGDQGGGNFKYDWNRVKSNPSAINSPEFLEAVAAGQVANWPEA